MRVAMNWLDVNPTLSGPRRAPIDTLGVFEQIAASADRYASEPALIHGDANVTYEELMGRIHDLRRQLVSLNISPGSAIVVQLPRGIDYIVTVLATLAHGSHFVPVAEAEPKERVSQIIRRVDAVAQVGLSRSRQPAISRLQDTDGSRREAPRLAYIMHTSGSTGVPKGADLSIAALRNLLNWYGEQLSITPDSRFAHLSRPSFDFSIPEIFLPLMHGGQMVIPLRPIASGLIPVAEYLIEHNVTILQLVPTLLRPLVSLLAAVPPMASQLQSIRTIVCNGEALPDRLRQDVARILPTATLVNSYGPTEACVAVTWHWCSQQQEGLPNIIGRPAPNVDLYVMSDDLKPVPTGTVGELWIGGVQVADGYAGAPVETQRSFIVRSRRGPSSQISDRVYRTGDLVRVLRDGNLEFIGRRDRQVQLRGVRVEIGEIEAAVKETDLCDEIRVAALPGAADSIADALVCFVTPATVDTDELQRRVRVRLPKDRWPYRFHALSILPATSNGKVDDTALLGIAQGLVQSAGTSSLPLANSSQDERSTPALMPAEHVLREALAVQVGRLPAAHEMLHELGLDSLGRMDLQVAMAASGYVLPQGPSFDEQSTVGEIAARMSRAEQTPTATLGEASYLGTDIGVLRHEFRQIFDQACEDSTELIVVQSSLPDFKDVSVHDALSALLAEVDRVAQRTTIALPAYTISFINRRQVDLTRDPSESGMTSSHALKTIGGFRTRHPVYSFVVIGRDGQAMAEIDWAERSTFGDDSIFGWFSTRNTKYVLLGTRALAHAHRCEYLAQVPYMSYTYIKGVITDSTGTRQGGAYVYARDVPDTCDEQLLGVDTDRIFELGQHAILSRDLSVCKAAIIDVRLLEQAVVSALQREPYALLKPKMRSQAKALVQGRS